MKRLLVVSLFVALAGPFAADADTTPPTGTVTINSGAAYTSGTVVTLTLSATDDSGVVAQMQFSNDNVTYSPPQAYTTARSWTLAAGAGAKTVYAKFRDAAGNWSVPASDTILLDTTAPTTPVVTDDGATTTSTTQLHATWTAATDAESGVVAYEYEIRQSSTTGTVIRSSTSVGTALSVTATGLTLANGANYFIGVRAKNGAGAYSTMAYSDGITIWTGAAGTPTGTIVINGGATYTGTPSVTLTLSATDDSGVVAQMQFSNDGVNFSPPETYATTRVWTLPFSAGTKTVSVKFKDGAGNWSAVFSATIILDLTPPGTVTVSDDGAVTSSTTQLHATWTAATDAESGVAEYQYQIRQDFASGALVRDWTPVGTATSVTATGLALTNQKNYYIMVRAKNGAGLLGSTAFSDGISVWSSGGFAVTGSPSTVPFGGAMTVTWTAPTGRPTTDFVALAPVGAANNTYMWSRPTSGAASGTATAPVQYVPGTYEFRYMFSSSLAAAASNPMTNLGDSTAPTAQITSPTTGTTLLTDAPLVVTGTATDATLLFYRVQYGVGTAPVSWSTLFVSSTPVSNGTLATIDVTKLAPDVYTFRLLVQDRGNNTAQATTVVTLDYIPLTNSTVSPGMIDPYNAERATISYTLGRTANTTIKIYRSSTKQLQRTITLSSQPAGAATVPWDGKTDVAAICPLEDAYYFTIDASDAAGRHGTYNNAASPRLLLSPQTSNASVNATSFDPFKNTPAQIAYSFSSLGRLSIYVRDTNSTVKNIRTLLNNAIRMGGSFTELWDGRKDDGTLHQGTFDVFFDVPAALPENPILLRRAVADLSSIHTEAYLIQPLYGETSAINYTLSRNATVTITLTNPNGSAVRTLLSAAAQTAGAQSVEWDGKNTGGQYVSVEGDYRVTFTAVDPTTGTSTTRYATVLVYR